MRRHGRTTEDTQTPVERGAASGECLAAGAVFYDERQSDPQRHLTRLIPDTDNENPLVPIRELVSRHLRQGSLSREFGRLDACQLLPLLVREEAVTVVSVEEVTRHWRSGG